MTYWNDLQIHVLVVCWKCVVDIHQMMHVFVYQNHMTEFQIGYQKELIQSITLTNS